MDREELRRVIEQALSEAVENETLDRLSRIEEAIEKQSEKLNRVLENLTEIIHRLEDLEELCEPVEEAQNQPEKQEQSLVDWQEILKNVRPLTEKLEEARLHNIFDKKDRCSDGADHNYPGSWGSVIPPNCSKCGKPARSMQSWSSDPKPPTYNHINIAEIAGLANDVAYLINDSAITKMLFRNRRTEG